jgi:hypothetical protein
VSDEKRKTNEPFRMVHMTNGRNYLYELYKLEQLIATFKDHVKNGGQPEVFVTLQVSHEGLRGNSFNAVIVDEEILGPLEGE